MSYMGHNEVAFHIRHKGQKKTYNDDRLRSKELARVTSGSGIDRRWFAPVRWVG